MRLLTLSLVGILVALSLISDQAASATEIVWLVDGESISTFGLSIEAAGLLSFIILKGGFLEPESIVDCTVDYTGLVNSAGQGTIESLLDRNGLEVTLSKTLECLNELNCISPLLVAENFPWSTRLTSMSGGFVALDLFASGENGLPAYELQCDGLSVETLCEGETSAVIALKLVEGGGTILFATFTSSELETESLEGNCGIHLSSSLQKGELAIKLVDLRELDVSEV